MLAIRSVMSETTAACFMKNFIHSVIVTFPSACSKPEFATPSASPENLASATVHSVDAIRGGDRAGVRAVRVGGLHQNPVLSSCPLRLFHCRRTS